MTDVRRDAMKVARGGETRLKQLRRQLNRLIDPHAEAQALFLGADGRPSPAAIEWLDRLARDNFLRTTTRPATASAEDMLVNEGRRQLALEIFGSLRLDVAELDRIRRQIREEEDGRRGND